MELQAHKLGPSSRDDRLRCVRADGSSCETAMPRQGTLPHDLIHAVVESALGFTDGFIGLVAKGADIAFLANDFHQHIEPLRYEQAAQAESVVEALQSQLWAGSFDGSAFRYGVETTCASRRVAPPDLSVCEPRRDMFERVIGLHAQWQVVPHHQIWSLRFPLDSAVAG